MQSGPFS